MAELFDCPPHNVMQHLQRIDEDEELQEAATTQDFLQVRQEGSRTVNRKIKHYNLDAVIAVGYRVDSKRATAFRKWATKVIDQKVTDLFATASDDDSRCATARRFFASVPNKLHYAVHRHTAAELGAMRCARG